MNSSLNVLMVDQAVTFGGSIVVMANIVNNLPVTTQATVVYEVHDDIAAELFNEHIQKYKVRHLLGYNASALMIHSIKNPRLKKTGFKLFSLLKMFFSYIQVLRLAKIILQKRIDIVHTNNSDEAITAARLLNRKVVLHLHGIGDYETHKLRNKADSYIAISDFVAEQGIKKGYDKNKITVLKNPVVENKIDPSRVDFYKNKFSINDGDKVFGIVGRVIQWKGQLEFLEAAAGVLSEFEHSKALIIGDMSDGTKNYFDKVKSRIAELGLEDRVIITGYIADVHNIMACLDVLVHSSISIEPFGLVLTEAMSMGIPVIASNKGAPPEIIKDGVTGRIIDSTETDRVASAITEFLSDNDLAKNIADTAKKDAFINYNIKQYIENLEGFYQRLLTKNH